MTPSGWVAPVPATSVPSPAQVFKTRRQPGYVAMTARADKYHGSNNSVYEGYPYPSNSVANVTIKASNSSIVSSEKWTAVLDESGNTYYRNEELGV